MHSPTTDIDQMIEELNQFQLPSSLMESFDAYREDAVTAASRGFNPSQLSWFLLGDHAKAAIGDQVKSGHREKA